MSVSSRQMQRLLLIVEELKKNQYPNRNDLVKILKAAEDAGDKGGYAVSTRTLARDIKTLQEEFNAPIVWRSEANGYHLTDLEWNFETPIKETDLSIFLLGLRLALDIIPEPLRSKIDSDIKTILLNGENNVEELSDAMIDSFISNSGTKSTVDPEIFRKVFWAWQNCQVISFVYKHPDGKESQHNFEPHIISFFKGAWYTKGYEVESRQVNCYAIQRISNIQSGFDCFDFKDKNLIERTKRHGLFETPRVDGIKLRCDSSMAITLQEQQKVRKYKIEQQEDGSVLLTMKPEDENAVLRWVLSEGGKIEVIYPPELRKKVAEAGKKIWDMNARS